MKILIVSGFLGAGKTTFIRRLSRNIGKRFVILENEYGAAGIDGARLGKDVAEEGNIWEMTEQCICCSKKGFCLFCPHDRQRGGSGISHRGTYGSRKAQQNHRESETDRI